jgi:hypothetical protein
MELLPLTALFLIAGAMRIAEAVMDHVWMASFLLGGVWLVLLHTEFSPRPLTRRTAISLIRTRRRLISLRAQWCPR